MPGEERGGEGGVSRESGGGARLTGTGERRVLLARLVVDLSPEEHEEGVCCKEHQPCARSSGSATAVQISISLRCSTFQEKRI